MKKLLIIGLLAAISLSAAGRQRYIAAGWPYQTIPQIADGGYWTTTITMVNVGTAAQNYKLVFRDDDGRPKEFSIARRGTANTFTGTIPAGGSVMLQTNGGGTQPNQGWADLDILGTDPDVAVMAIFGTKGIPGRPDFEATVTGSSGVDYEGSLPFDNTGGYVTSVAILNPGSYSDSSVPIRILDENGVELRRETITLAAGRKQAYAIPERWPETAGKRGAIRFEGSLCSWSVLGLRFNPSGAFTTVNLLEP
jgi:hypothetical protein